MIQFVIYGVYAIYCSLIIEGIPLYFLLLVHIQSPVFFILFAHFYIKAYIKNRNINKSVDDNCNDRKGVERNGIEKYGYIKDKINDQNNNGIQAIEKSKDK